MDEITKAKRKKYRKDFVSKRKEKGLCLRCGGKNNNLPHVNCLECATKLKDAARRKYRGVSDEEYRIKRLTFEGVVYNTYEEMKAARYKAQLARNLVKSRLRRGIPLDRPVLKRGYASSSVEVVDAETESVIDIYNTTAEMAEDLGLSMSTTYYRISKKKVIDGIYYRRKEGKQ